MLRIKYIVFSALLLLVYNISASTTPETVELRLYQSYKLGKMDVWVKVMDELNNQYKVHPSSELLYRIVEIQYGYIGYLIGLNDNRTAKDYLSKAEKNVDVILQLQPQNADALAIKASLLAFHIALSPYKAPFLGPKSISLIDEAYSKRKDSPQVLIEKGNSLHYAPKMFGGDTEMAIKFYLRAIATFENQNNGIYPQSWLYLNTITQLALAYEKSNQNQKALATYRHILNIAPDFKWVKDDIYPTFVSKGLK
jgi:tetratricopeptide (TPR) repeat protein